MNTDRQRAKRASHGSGAGHGARASDRVGESEGRSPSDKVVEYCREIESYLCKKNGGHLIRIVGPAFEMVREWAGQGIPLKVAFRGIDRTCERRAAKSQSRRPLRIEFCEGDVVEAFDDWRRAIGTGADRVSESRPPKESLASHIERTVTRLLAVPLNGEAAELSSTIASTITALDGMVDSARQARGEARARIIERLSDLDRSLIEAARKHIDKDSADALRKEVESDLAPYAMRMADEARSKAAALAYERLLRESYRLPTIAYQER